jgi:hypothetical protein
MLLGAASQMPYCSEGLSILDEQPIVIKNFGDFSPGSLERFLTKLAQQGEQD